MKCAFCKRSEDEIRKDEGHLVAMKAKPDVSICNTCVDLARSGKMTDVNSEKRVVTYLGDDSDET